MATTPGSFEGGFDEVTGKVESAAGEVFGDTKMQADGKVTELKGKAEQVIGKAKDAYGRATETVKDWADRAPEVTQQAREQAARFAEESSARVRQTVQEQPVAVLAGGIALGFVVGWLLSGRK